MIDRSQFARLPPFASLTPADVARIATTARSFEHSPRAWLFRPMDPCVSIIIVADGFVRLARSDSDGAEVTVGLVGPGGLADISALRGCSAHDAGAQALSHVRTVELPAAGLLDMASHSPCVFEALVRCLITRRNDVYVDAVAAAGEDLSVRLLATLLRLARPAATGAERPLAVRLSHADVARLIGADRSTVTRLIGALAEQGFVRRERGHVTGIAAPESHHDPACREAGEPASYR